MTIHEAFEKMLSGKCVRITPEFRAYWEDGKVIPLILGQWFTIQSIETDSAELCSNDTHEIFRNVPVKHILP